jgi:hypothetical protein
VCIDAIQNFFCTTEYVTVCHATQKVIWLRHFLKDLYYLQVKRTQNIKKTKLPSKLKRMRCFNLERIASSFDTTSAVNLSNLEKSMLVCKICNFCSDSTHMPRSGSVEDQTSAARLVLQEVHASRRKNKAVDKFSQARADPHASIQYTANHSLKSHLNQNTQVLVCEDISA